MNLMRNLMACGLILISSQYLISKPTQLISITLDAAEPLPTNVDEYGNLELGTIARTLYIHLIEKESIIITTSSLLNFVMLILEKNDNPFDLKAKPKIDPSDFITRVVDDYFYILVPKKYIENRPNYQAIKKLDLKNLGTSYTAEELTIGIQLQGNQIDNKDFFKPSTYKEKDDYLQQSIYLPSFYLGSFPAGFRDDSNERRQAWLSNHFIKNLPTIFIDTEVYKKLNILNLAPTSVVIIDGHGSQHADIDREIRSLQTTIKLYPTNQKKLDELLQLKKEGVTTLLGGIIAGLEGHDFGNFVGYLSKNLQLSLLFFNTCYGSEINLSYALKALAQKEKKEVKDLTIPYPIISGAISNAPSSDALVGIGDTIIRPIYKKFMDTLMSNKSVSDDLFIEALEHIYEFFYKGSPKQYNNIPLIKYPNTDTWRPLDMPDKILIISPSFIQKHKNETSLDLSTLFSKQTKPYQRVVLLAVPAIPFKLVVSGSDYIELPAFVPYLPGNSMYSIPKISAENFTLTSIFSSFLSIKKLENTVTFLIGELTGYDNLLGTTKPITLEYVLITNAFEKVLFVYNGEAYEISMSQKNRNPKKISFSDFQKQWDETADTFEKFEEHFQSLQPTNKPTTPITPPITPPTTQNTGNNVKLAQEANDLTDKLGAALFDIVQL